MDQNTESIPIPNKPTTIARTGVAKSRLAVGSQSMYSIRRHNTVPRESKLRRWQPQPANKEIVRRALTQPCRRPTGRWLNFRPKPSRLSNMSVA